MTSKKLYKLVNHEDSSVCWFTDAQDLHFLAEWLEEVEHSIYVYELVDTWGNYDE